MALPAVAGNTIFATDLYGLAQPSGGQEIGGYYISTWGNAGNDVFGYFVSSVSRNSTPVSVSVDQSYNAASGVNAPSTNTLKSTGFHVYTGTTGVTTNANVGGQYTLQF